MTEVAARLAAALAARYRIEREQGQGGMGAQGRDPCRLAASQLS
jgi:hypothetical protein